MRVVREPIEDGVDERRRVDVFVQVLDGQLTGDQRRSVVVGSQSKQRYIGAWGNVTAIP